MIELSVSIASVPLEAIMSQASVLGNFKVDFFIQISLSYLSEDQLCCLHKGISEAVFLVIFLWRQYKNKSSFTMQS